MSFLHLKQENNLNPLEFMLTSLGLELAKDYSGKINLGKFEPDIDDLSEGDISFYFLEELTKGPKILGFIPTKENNLILCVENYPFYIKPGVIKEDLYDYTAEQKIRRFLEEFAGNNNAELLIRKEKPSKKISIF